MIHLKFNRYLFFPLIFKYFVTLIDILYFLISGSKTQKYNKKKLNVFKERYIKTKKVDMHIAWIKKEKKRETKNKNKNTCKRN